jgi:hypothetical protein
MGVSDVKVQLYTVAFRKVFEKKYPGQAAGQDCLISNRSGQLVDTWGNPLSSGLYYVVVTTNSGRTIGKMLVLR